LERKLGILENDEKEKAKNQGKKTTKTKSDRRGQGNGQVMSTSHPLGLAGVGGGKKSLNLVESIGGKGGQIEWDFARFHTRGEKKKKRGYDDTKTDFHLVGQGGRREGGGESFEFQGSGNKDKPNLRKKTG